MLDAIIVQREPGYERETTIEERWDHAFSKSLTERRQAIFIDHAHFQVLSSKSTYKNRIAYDITFTGRGRTGWVCTCESGYSTTACYHRATVLKRLKREPHLTNPPPPPLVVRSEVARARELREQASVIQAHSARLKTEYQARHEREAVTVPATKLEDLYQ